MKPAQHRKNGRQKLEIDFAPGGGKLGAETAGSDQPRLPRHSAGGILAVLHVNITTSLYVDNSNSSPMSSLVSRHTIRQLECVFPGALATYYYGTISEFLQILSGNPHGNPVQGGWLARKSAFLSLALALLTVSLFVYILLLPIIKGEHPNYRSWRESGPLSKVIPILTASIVFGWSLSVFTLGHWTTLGYVGGVIATTGLYALGFGILGLLPIPKVRKPHD